MQHLFNIGTPPTLINLPNNVSLYEHVPVGTLVFHVRGSDVDNGSLSYFIIDTTDTFEINKDSGNSSHGKLVIKEVKISRRQRERERQCG